MSAVADSLAGPILAMEYSSNGGDSGGLADNRIGLLSTDVVAHALGSLPNNLLHTGDTDERAKALPIDLCYLLVQEL